MHSHDSGQRAVHNHHTSRGSHFSPDRTRRHVENSDSPSCHRHGDRRQWLFGFGLVLNEVLFIVKGAGSSYSKLDIYFSMF